MGVNERRMEVRECPHHLFRMAVHHSEPEWNEICTFGQLYVRISVPLLYVNSKTFGVVPDGEPVPGYVDSPTKTYSISSDAFLVGEQWHNTEEEKDSILSGAYADALRECEVDCDVYRAVIEFLMLCFRGVIETDSTEISSDISSTVTGRMS